MDTIRTYRDQIALVASVVLPLVVAAILVPFRSGFANTASALILVAVIVAVAALGNRVSGFVATVSATLWFDFFLTRPYEKFAITHRPDIETAVSLFVVGIIVTELAARNRHHHATATQEADYVGLIYDVSELTALGASANEVVERVRGELVDLLHLPRCTLRPSRGRAPHDATRPRRPRSARRPDLGCRAYGSPGPRDRTPRAESWRSTGPLRADTDPRVPDLVRTSGRCGRLG